MTWEELKEKAKEMGYDVIKKYSYTDKEALTQNGYTFTQTGCFIIDGFNDAIEYERTPSQMLMIMRGLE